MTNASPQGSTDLKPAALPFRASESGSSQTGPPRRFADPSTHAARVVVTPEFGGMDAALRRLRATVEMPEIRRRARFVGPSERRRDKHLRALRRRRRRSA
jgi:ribosomal protein S21